MKPFSKEQFITYYLKDNVIGLKSKADFNKTMVALPCECAYEDCKGWSAVIRNLLLFDLHNDTRNPQTDEEKWQIIDAIFDEFITKTYPTHCFASAESRILYGGHRIDQMEGFIIDLKSSILSLDDYYNEKAVQGVIHRFYEATYKEALPGMNQVVLDKENLLQHLENNLFSNLAIYDKVWETAQHYPNIKAMESMGIIDPIQQLSELSVELKKRNVVLREGQVWSIKGQPYCINGYQSSTNFIIEKLDVFAITKKILLSEILPLTADDFIYQKDADMRFPPIGLN